MLSAELQARLVGEVLEPLHFVEVDVPALGADLVRLRAGEGEEVRPAEATTGTVTDTVNFLSSSVSDTASNIKYGVDSVTDYLALIFEIIQVVRSAFGKK